MAGPRRINDKTLRDLAQLAEDDAIERIRAPHYTAYCGACGEFRTLTVPILKTHESGDICCATCDYVIATVRREPEVTTEDVSQK